MSITTHNGIDSSEGARRIDAFSSEASTRSIEVAFLRRITDAAKQAGAAILNRTQSDAGSVSVSLSLMQSPVFKRAARELEKSIAEESGFGPFRKES